MDIRLAEGFAGKAGAEAAAQEIRKCVHCGMCLASCPTHQLWGNELDSPRGRIYLVKSALETGAPNETLRLHLDRCLTCRACETACPSNVGYAAIANQGREIASGLDRPRGLAERIKRFILVEIVSRPRVFRLLLSAVRPFLPLSPAHARMFGPSARSAKLERPPSAGKRKKFALFPGCVQQVAGMSTNQSLINVFAAAGIDVEVIDSPCCGALHHHIGLHGRAKRVMQSNMDKVCKRLESGDFAGIVMAASGCGLMLKEYASCFRGDEREKEAELFSRHVKDPVEVVDAEWKSLEGRLRRKEPGSRVVFHSPCTLQHGQCLGGLVERMLIRAGFDLQEAEDGETCCGAAGSYFLLYPKTAERLRRHKTGALLAKAPETVLSSNIGCIMHIRQGTDIPASHWLDALADRIQ